MKQWGQLWQKHRVYPTSFKIRVGIQKHEQFGCKTEQQSQLFCLFDPDLPWFTTSWYIYSPYLHRVDIKDLRWSLNTDSLWTQTGPLSFCCCKNLALAAITWISFFFSVSTFKFCVISTLKPANFRKKNTKSMVEAKVEKHKNRSKATGLVKQVNCNINSVTTYWWFDDSPWHLNTSSRYGNVFLLTLHLKKSTRNDGKEEANLCQL